MNTLKNISVFIKENVILSILFFIVFMIFTYVLYYPLKLYFDTFSGELSNDKEAWSAFGTYVGGVYGPIATLLSVIVLIITLFEINRSNKKMIDQNKNFNIISEILDLSKLLDTSIERKKGFSNQRTKTFEWFAFAVGEHFIINGAPANEDEIIEASKNRFKDDEIEIFRDELQILKEILIRVNIIESQELKERAQSIFKARIPNLERYWLERFAQRFDNGVYELLKSWHSFSNTPKDLYDLLDDPKDSQEVY
ncbi:TPA: hypothetical protein ACGQSM_004296 [Serratia liquefaciens]